MFEYLFIPVHFFHDITMHTHFVQYIIVLHQDHLLSKTNIVNFIDDQKFAFRVNTSKLEKLRHTSKILRK